MFTGSIHVLGCCCSGAGIVPWFGAAACAGKVLSGGMELASGGCSDRRYK